MATYFWVPAGGTSSGTWDSTNTVHWSLSSGGVGGAGPPLVTDDVKFNANSFDTTGRTVTIGTGATCKDMDWTGATNTPTMGGSAALIISGSVALISGMTYSHTGGVTLTSSSLSATITMAGKNPNENYTINCTGRYTLQDDFVFSTVGSRTLTITQGGFYGNGKSINLDAFSSSNTNARDINIDSCTITMRGKISTAFQMGTSSTGLTWSAVGTTWIIDTTTAGANASATISMNSANINLNIGSYLIFRGNFGGSQFNFSNGSFTVGTIVYDRNVSAIFQFSSTQNYTITNFTNLSTSGVLTFKTGSAGSAATLTKAGGGTISIERLKVQDITALPINTWTAEGITGNNISGNTNWNFVSRTRRSSRTAASARSSASARTSS